MKRYNLSLQLQDIYDNDFTSKGRRPVIGITGNHDELTCKLGEGYYQQVVRAGGTPFVIPPVADSDYLLSVLNRIDALLLSGGSDVNPEIFGREGFASLFFVLEVDGLLTDDARDGTVFALDDDTEAWEDVGVDTANLIEIQKSAVVDVTDYETNFVGMRHEHDLGAFFAFATGDAVAVGIGCDFVDIGTDGIGEESCDALLTA